MTFAHPWLLLGAAAALIPLLVHLFDRRRPRPVPFAAISFVLRSQRRTASRLKLRRLLLYILRTLILLALPVALARPQWRAPAAMARTQRGPAATALILDASLSMRFADGESLFERGRSLARDALKDLSAEEPATVVICGPGAPPAAPIGFDRARLRSALDEAKPTYGMADLNQCMELAARALDESPMAAKRIVLVSDFTAPALHIESPPPMVAGAKGERVRPDFVLRDAARGRAILPNHAVMDLKVEPAIQVGPRAYQFTFAVHNFSNEPLKDLVALLKVGDRTVAKGFVDVPPGGTAQKTLAHSFDVGGSFSGEVALAPDFLAEDDRHSFVVHVPRELHALVINGAPNSVRYRDHAFFVEAALSAGGSPVRETVRDAESAFHEPFDGYELLFLLDVRAPPPDVAARLVDFVQKGGGLFVSMGDEVDAEAYNQRLGALLPRPLRLVKTSALPGDPDAEAKAAKLGQINFEHALFSPFVGRAREGLLSARFYRYMLLEPEARGGGEPSQVLAAYDDGAPALAFIRRERGRVLLYTSTVDRSWADLPIRTSFLPLLQRASSLLTGSLDERGELKARVGESVTLRPDAQQPVGSVKAPSGASVAVRPQPDGTVVAGPLAEPGAYRVLDDKGGALSSLAFTVQLDPAESDLTRLKPQELSDYFGEEAVRQGVGTGAERSTPLWTWLILIGALAFFFEGVLLRKV